MQNVITILEELISIPSFVDKSNNEKEIISYIKNKLQQNKKLQIVEQVVEGTRRNLIVTDSHNPKIILFGHMDTVLPKKQNNNPLPPVNKDGNIYGLGSCDMKSGLAVMLDIAVNNHRGVGYVFSVDEEYSFKGAIKLKEITNLQPEVIINLEPTDLKIINSCRGITEFELEVYGKSAHSGRKQLGINAIEKSIELINKFEKVCQANDSKDIKTSINLAYLLGGLKTDDKGEVKIMGNIVPNFAKVVVEIRIGNKVITKQFINMTLEKLAEEFELKITKPQYKFYFGPMFTEKNKLINFEEAISKSNLNPTYADVSKSGYYELQQLQEAWGGNCIVFGATPMEKSHAENEYVEIESVLKLKTVIENFIKSYFTKDSNK